MFTNLTRAPDMSVSREFFFIFNEFNSAKDYAIDITAVVLTVGGAFAVLGFLAIVLQQHGVDISSGLNTITAMPKWAGFLGLGLTTAGAIIGSVISAMRIRKFLEQTYSKSELEPLNSATLSEVDKGTLLATLQKIYHIQGNVVFVKDLGRVAIYKVGFKDPMWVSKYQERLHQSGYKSIERHLLDIGMGRSSTEKREE